MAPLGKTGLQVTRITLGGAHMRFGSEENALRIIRRALDLGINFFDSARKYNDGESDACYGKVITGAIRQKVFLMSKAHLRTRDEAMGQLEGTLRAMKTDYLDLWQCHEVVSRSLSMSNTSRATNEVAWRIPSGFLEGRFGSVTWSPGAGIDRSFVRVADDPPGVPKTSL
jgi:aryl-alcohol dehydrogenase-like predicted oxidoreductase